MIGAPAVRDKRKTKLHWTNALQNKTKIPTKNYLQLVIYIETTEPDFNNSRN